MYIRYMRKWYYTMLESILIQIAPIFIKKYKQMRTIAYESTAKYEPFHDGLDATVWLLFSPTKSTKEIFLKYLENIYICVSSCLPYRKSYIKSNTKWQQDMIVSNRFIKYESKELSSHSS